MLRAAQNSGPIVGRTPLREILESFRTHAANDLFTVRNGASADRDQALPSSRHWVHTTKSDNEPGTHPGGASHSTHRWEQSTANSESRTNGSIKIKLLEEAMNHVPNYGWSDVTLQIAATDLGLSFAVLGALPRGPGHLIDFFHAKCNDELENRLCEKFKDYRSDTDPVTGMDRVAYGARCRLEMVLPYIGKSWVKAIYVQYMYMCIS